MALSKNSAKPAEKETKKAAPAANPAKVAAKAPKGAVKAAPVPKPVPKEPAPEVARIGRKEIAAALRAKVTTAGAAISEKVANIVAVAYEEVIGDALEAGQQVVLPGFGQFLIQHRPEAQKRSPATGEEITVAAHNVVKFRAGSKIKARVNLGESSDAAADDGDGGDE